MDKAISWIKAIGYPEADANLKVAFDKCRGPNGQIDNLYKAYSLMPHALGPADELYKSVLHHQNNRLPKWLAELIATYVAILDECLYAQSHHRHNFLTLYGDREKGERILAALSETQEVVGLAPKSSEILSFVRQLSKAPQDMTEANVQNLRDHGLNDSEILEVVQIVASFAYFTRVINGLGIEIGAERTGFYRSD